MNKKLVINFSIMLFLCSFSYALINVQIIPFMTRIGYSSAQRGLILSFSSLISIFGQLWIGHLSDKLKTVKYVFISSTIALIVFMVFGYSNLSYIFIYHFLVIGLGLMLFRISTNLAETWILGVNDARDHFGSIRGTGSVGWAISSLISSIIIGYFGYQGLAVGFAFTSLLILIMATRIPDIDSVSSKKIDISDTKEILKNKNYVVLIVVFFLAFFVMNADNFTVTDLILELGGTEREVGLRWFIQGLLELPAFAFGSILIKKLNGKNFLRLTIGAVFLRFLLYSFAFTFTQIVLISLLQLVTFPLLVIGQRLLIYEESPEHLKSTGQMIAVSITMSISSILTPAFAGYLALSFTNNTILLIFSLISLLPFFILSFYKEKATS